MRWPQCFRLSLFGLLLTLLLNTPTTALQDWLYAADLASAEPYLQNTSISGVQLLYAWDILEPHRSCYNFTPILSDIHHLSNLPHPLPLWIQLQDRTFSPKHNPVPPYLRNQPYYSNGSVPSCDGNACSYPSNFTLSGWAASQWNSHVRERFQALLVAIAKHPQIGCKIYGINFPETAIAIDESANDFNNVSYFDGTLANAAYARSVFRPEVYVVQYVNFWPDAYADPVVMNASFASLQQHGVGVGGPDDIPGRKALEDNIYPFMREYKGTLSIETIAVQEPDLAAKSTSTGKPFTREDFTNFAEELGASIIFWATSAPWLQGS